MNKQPLDLRDPNQYEIYSLHCVDEQYINLGNAILACGTDEHDNGRTEDTWRTLIGIGFQLSNTLIAFPALLSARKNWYAAVDETCWFMRGDTNISSLNSKIWDSWADEEGECGPIYGEMWRRWPDLKAYYDYTQPQHSEPTAEMIRVRNEILRMREDGYIETQLTDGRILFEGQIDQFANALHQVMARSRSRRIRVQAFNPAYQNMQGLPPCHTEFEFNVTQPTPYEIAQMEARGMAPSDASLHIVVTMRSNDVLLGRPFNIMGYSAMHQLIAKWAGLNVGSFTLNTTNTHLYTHHFEAFEQQKQQWAALSDLMKKTGQPIQYPLLEISDDILGLTPEELLDNANAEWFQLLDYSPAPAVKGRVTK